MRKILTPVMLALSLLATASESGATSQSQNPPLWLRYQRISPDGTTIAFSYQGDIYTVPQGGGRATRITSHPDYDYAPLWSPDSKQLVFASDREGSDDIYVVSREGGVPRRLTFSSATELPLAFDNAGRLLYSMYGMPARQFDQLPSSSMKQIYSLPLSGGRPRLESSLTMLEPDVAPSGDILYTDYKGYEDNFRKHHTSSVARDIWKRGTDGKYTKLTSFKGEDRNAVWDGKGGFYYLSEQDGTFNVYHRSSTEPTAQTSQLTHYKGNPVRYLSRSKDGVLCYGYDGEIYTLREGGKPQKVKITIISDNLEPDKEVSTIRSGARSYAVSPKGDEFAVVVRGDVYVVNMEYGTSKRITNTPEEERNVTFSPDGRTLVYDSQRKGQWQLYKSELVRKEDKNFVYAKAVKETQLTFEAKPCFQPLFNPKGGEVAFLRDRNEVAVLKVKDGATRTVVPHGLNFSYSDGDIVFQWSSNGKYILSQYQGQGGWAHTDCALYRADGSGLEANLTQSGYSDQNGRFALGDKAITFISDRAGYRSHGSWGATSDVYLMFLTDKAYQEFRLSKEDKALLKERKTAEEEKAKKSDSGKKADKKKSKKSAKDKSTDKDKGAKADSTQTATKKEEPIKFDFDNLDRHTVRISRTSGAISDAIMNAEGTKLYFVARYESSTDLWEYNLEDKSSKIIAPNTSGSFITSADGKKIYLESSRGLYDLQSRKTHGFAVEFELKPQAERSHLFDHVQTTIRDKFYDVNLHGVDWAKYGETYGKFLPYINNDRDFAELLSEMLGELNASHTGARYYGGGSPAQPTAALGAFFSPNHKGDGLLVDEVLVGSPLSGTDKEIKAGMVIEAIDGETIKDNTPLELYLNGKVGKLTTLTIKPEKGAKFEVTIRPISLSAQTELLYERWLRKREALVKEWSDGKIGYVYVRAMNSPSFRTVFKDLLGKYRNCSAVVVDTRYNGGGWLHEDLAILLGGKLYATLTPRGQYAGDDPFMQWNKLSCVLMNEGNYSNGHGFPYTYKQLGLGKLIGTPVAGTMTAVWWEQLFPGTIVYGIPQVTVSDLQGKPLENNQLYPDVEVYNSPEDYNGGYDRQLKRSVKEMLKTVKTGK